MTIKTFLRWIFAAVLILGIAAAGFAQASAGRGAPAARSYQLTITSNVANANIYMDGSYAGQAPHTFNVTPGAHSITVRGNGYNDYSTSVNVTSDMSVNAQLQPMNFSLSISSNVDGADVFINGQRMGRAPYNTTLAPGTYELRVQANGYQNFTTQVVLNQNSTINAQLQAMMAVLHIDIPDNFLNINSDRGRGDKRRAQSDIQVLIDNHPVNQDNLRVTQGNHTIAFESGSLMVQQNFFFNGGQEYTISPQLTISIK